MTDIPSHTAWLFLWLAILLLGAKCSSVVERFGQPAVLGELLIGILFGNLFLLPQLAPHHILPTLTGSSIVSHIAIFFEPVKHDPILAFLAELGVVLLLFQIGLDTHIDTMRRVGVRAFWVACVGVFCPFFLATEVVGPWLLPSLSFQGDLFLGATLAATSVGITARVFLDLGQLQTPEAQMVLGAAVIDDILGLLILAAVSAIVMQGHLTFSSLLWIVAKSVLFLGGILALSRPLLHRLGQTLSKIHRGAGMKFTLAFSLCLILSYLAQTIGLAPIVGAFAAGLVLEPLFFQPFREPRIVEEVKTNLQRLDPTLQKSLLPLMEGHSRRHVGDMMESLGHFLVPLFFVMTGMHVRLETFFHLSAFGIALGITAVAILGKILAGGVAGPVRKMLVGWGMVPRGEVGLIFAQVGHSLGVLSNSIFSILVITVVLTTLLPPPILAYLLRKPKNAP